MIPILTKIEVKEISERIGKYAEKLITENLPSDWITSATNENKAWNIW